VRLVRLGLDSDVTFWQNNGIPMLSQLLARFSRKRRAVLSDVPASVVPTTDRAPQVSTASTAASPGSTQVRSGITFAVDNVTPAAKPIWSETLADSLGRRFKRKILVLPEADLVITNADADGMLRYRDQMRSEPVKSSFASSFLSKSDDDLARDVGSRCHPLIDAVHTAFAQHRPLILSPDDIWLVIAQGFSHHVTENAEALRQRLVRHQGRRELSTNVLDLSVASFEQAIGSFSVQIRNETDPVLHETLICDFSTTTTAIRVASEVALMDTFSSYFTYVVGCVCGIPKITIQGSPEDWHRIRARVEVLGTYGLEWWVARLRPILDEFVLAASGRPTPDFWKAIYKPEKAYATTLTTGWITDLFPYLGDGPQRRRNPVLALARQGWALPVRSGVPPKSFPSGLSSVPIKVEIKGERFDLDLVAGFLAVKQNSSDLALSTVIGWSVAEPPPKTPVVLRG
jgi:hypothetical protein